MVVRIVESAGHVWVHDRADHLDHAMPRRDLIDAYRRKADACRAACGHLVGRDTHSRATGHLCTECATAAPRPSWWRRLIGGAS